MGLEVMVIFLLIIGGAVISILIYMKYTQNKTQNRQELYKQAGIVELDENAHRTK